MGPLLGGKALRPASLRSNWLIGQRKWGHSSTLKSFSLFLPVSKGSPDYCLGLMLLFMHAVDFHCPSCLTNWNKNRSGYLRAACIKTTSSSLFMSGSWPKWVYWLQFELFRMTRPVLLPVFESLPITAFRDSVVKLMYVLAHDGLQSEENRSFDFRREVKLLCVYICVWVFVWSVWDGMLPRFLIPMATYLLITEATALLVFAYGYFVPFDSAAPQNCQ